jgi:hypothetical protein
MPEYTGWDNYQEQKRKDERDPDIIALEKIALNLNNRLVFLEDKIKDIEETLTYNQIRLPLDYGRLRFTPSVDSYYDF